MAYLAEPLIIFVSQNFLQLEYTLSLSTRVRLRELPKKRNCPFTDFDNWPYIVQMSWLVYDSNKQEIESINDYIVKLPENVKIPRDSVKIHGITNKKMRERGENILDVLMEFKRDISNSSVLVAHNLVK